MSMEIDITDFFNAAAPKDHSATDAEIGQNAGAYTWRAACEDAPDWPLLDTEDKREAFRAHVRGFGAWTDDEIAAWSDTELTALFMQLVAGDMREAGLHAGMTAEEWTDYATAAAQGQVTGNIFGGPLSIDGRVYYTLED